MSCAAAAAAAVAAAAAADDEERKAHDDDANAATVAVAGEQKPCSSLSLSLFLAIPLTDISRVRSPS